MPDGVTAGNLVVAYEPVWAIGTGLTPTPDDVAEMHGLIRERLTERFGAEGEGVRILYGGSVKPSNAGELMGVANVDGALVGGASLKPMISWRSRCMPIRCAPSWSDSDGSRLRCPRSR